LIVILSFCRFLCNFDQIWSQVTGRQGFQ